MIVSSGYRKNGFDAHGGKLLQKKDMDFWMNLPERTDPSGICFELSEEVEEVEQGFFELVPTICELRILNPDCRLYLSEKEKELFQKNNVLIRGDFDTSAEAFAKENRLYFLHTDTVIAREGDYYEREIDILTLCFYQDGSAYINQTKTAKEYPRETPAAVKSILISPRISTKQCRQRMSRECAGEIAITIFWKEEY